MKKKTVVRKKRAVKKRTRKARPYGLPEMITHIQETDTGDMRVSAGGSIKVTRKYHGDFVGIESNCIATCTVDPENAKGAADALAAFTREQILTDFDHKVEAIREMYEDE